MPVALPPLPPLTREECAQFKRDGVLIKPRALDPELCRRAVDLIWRHNAAHVPSAHLRRGDPSTYVGPFPEADRISHGVLGGHVRDGDGWQVRSQTPGRQSHRSA